MLLIVAFSLITYIEFTYRSLYGNYAKGFEDVATSVSDMGRLGSSSQRTGLHFTRNAPQQGRAEGAG